MDKRRIQVRVTDTTTGFIKCEFVADLNLYYRDYRNQLHKYLDLYIDDLRNSYEFCSIEFACFKDPVKEGVIPF